MKKIIGYRKLVVNPENYRFDPVDNPDEAIDLMLEEKGSEIHFLAKHILENGLDKSRDLRVLEKDKNTYLVLDGNRRATAIKCLHDPTIIKDGALRRKFEALLKNGKTPVSEINCFVYRTEKDASEWIKLDHTGKNGGAGQDPWYAAEVDRFDYKFGGKLSPATQLVDLYVNKTGKKIKTKALKISTVNRLLSNPESRSYLGVDVSKGQIDLVANEEDVISRVGSLFTKIIKDNTAVAEVYKTDLAIKFMKRLFRDKPEPSASGASSTTIASQQNSKKGSSRKPHPKSTIRKFLIPKDCVLKIKPDKVNNIYRELRDDLILDNTPEATPNAVGVLFRVFLEVSLDYYSEKECGRTFKIDDTINQKIEFVANYMVTKTIATNKQLSPIRSVSGSKKIDILHIQRFHEYVHSATIQPDPASLKTKWDNIQEFFEILWGDLEKKGK